MNRPRLSRPAPLPPELWVVIGFLGAAGLCTGIPVLQALPDALDLVTEGGLWESFGPLVLVLVVELGLVAAACLLLAWRVSQSDPVARMVAVVVAGSLAFGLVLGEGIDGWEGTVTLISCLGVLACLTAPPRVREYFATLPSARGRPAPVVAAEAVVVVLAGVLLAIGVAYLPLASVKATYAIAGLALIGVSVVCFRNRRRIETGDPAARALMSGLMAGYLVAILLGTEGALTGPLFVPFGVAVAVVVLLWIPQESQAFFGGWATGGGGGRAGVRTARTADGSAREMPPPLPPETSGRSSVSPFEPPPLERSGFEPGRFDPTPFDSGPFDSGPFDPAPFDSGPFDSGPFDSGPSPAGRSPAGRWRSAGSRTARSQPTEPQTAGSPTAGSQSAGSPTAGSQSAGSQSAGSQSAGSQSIESRWDAPRSGTFQPSEFEPGGFEPRAFDPREFESGAFEPGAFEPREFEPQELGPSRFDPPPAPPRPPTVAEAAEAAAASALAPRSPVPPIPPPPPPPSIPPPAIRTSTPPPPPPPSVPTVQTPTPPPPPPVSVPAPRRTPAGPPSWLLEPPPVGFWPAERRRPDPRRYEVVDVAPTAGDELQAAAGVGVRFDTTSWFPVLEDREQVRGAYLVSMVMFEEAPDATAFRGTSTLLITSSR
ncbi:MAG: hypothetical protein QOE93_2183, partial [Actinomycetota bacterium]|nr:hypothetical protein [Actinomycetota bacterium]